MALVTAVDLDLDGKLVVNLLDPESRLDVPGSGQYAALRDENGKLLWSSPSLAGTGSGARQQVAGRWSGFSLSAGARWQHQSRS